MSDDPLDSAAVAADAEAIDDALAAFEDACSGLVRAAESATSRPPGHRHLAAVRDRLAEVSVPVTAATADALLVSAADARAALQRVVARETTGDPLPPEEDDALPVRPRADVEDELAEPDPVLDLAPEPVEPPPAPAGYRACTVLPTRNIPHVLVCEDGRWQRAAIVYAADDALTVRFAPVARG